MQTRNEAPDFYESVLRELLDDGRISTESSILVVCGDDHDWQTLRNLGFANVTISNLDDRLQQSSENPFEPYAWSYDDAENLSHPDGSFDFVLVHSGLHHLHSPQKGLAEMYRVASRGILGFEPNQNLFTRLGVKLGFGQQYETAAVFFNDCRFGGVANSQIPNYVYRFTKAEVIKTIQAYSPIAAHRYRFWHATRIPSRLYQTKSASRRMLVATSERLLRFLGGNFPMLANNMAFFVPKPTIPEDLFPWLNLKEGSIVPDETYLNRIYFRRSL